MSALASPASLKGVLSAQQAAAFLAEGFRRGGTGAVELPIADGGEGTAEVLGAHVRERVRVPDAFGRPREVPIRGLADGTAVVEAAEVCDLIARDDAGRLPVCLGRTATGDGGAALREALDELPAPTTVLCDALVPLRDAARRFAPQKGATPEQAELLERRLAAMKELAPYAELPGAGAAGGLGAALAALGAELVPGAREVLTVSHLGWQGRPLVSRLAGSTRRRRRARRRRASRVPRRRRSLRRLRRPVREFSSGGDG